jgi:hypothetical protein
MPELFEFDIIFALPEGKHDAFDLSDVVYEAGYDDAVIGTGQAGRLAVALELEGDSAESAILTAARAILQHLPVGSVLREVRPDLVSLADVAKRLNIQRQSLQKRAMPPLAMAGFYRVTEIEQALAAPDKKGNKKTRRARFSLERAKPWFAAGRGAQRLNARISLGMLDPVSLEVREQPTLYRG